MAQRRTINEPAVLLRALVRPGLALIVLVVVAFVVEPKRLVTEIEQFRDWLEQAGPAGVLAFVGLYVLATVALVPMSLLKVVAGGLFGGLWGVVIATAGLTVGASACFLIARYVMSGPLRQRLERTARFRRVSRIARRHEAAIVALTRLFPLLPGNVMNYAFGVLEVRLRTFALWTMIASLPSTILLTVGADVILDGLGPERLSWPQLAVVGGALCLVAVGSLAAARAARRLVGELEDDERNGLGPSAP